MRTKPVSYLLKAQRSFLFTEADILTIRAFADPKVLFELASIAFLSHRRSLEDKLK